MFSWFDSYDIFNEAGNTVFTVRGQMGVGHRFRIFDANGNEVGAVNQKCWSFLPCFNIIINGELKGAIKKQFSFFRPKFTVDYMGWTIDGNYFEWDYEVRDMMGSPVARVSKEFFNWTDTYSIDVAYEDNALAALMLVIAIDAEKSISNH